MNRIPLILIGGGGHCKACIDVIEQEGKFAIKGIVDAQLNTAENVLGYAVIGNDSLIPGLVRENFHFMVTVGQIKSAAIRKRIFDNLEILHANIATVVSPLAYVSRHALLGKGSIVMHGALVNAGARIGSNVIINTNALVEHEATIGDHVHISTASVVNGNVKVGNEVFIGSQSVLSNNIEIRSQVVIGAGAAVTKSIMQSGTYAGNPCKLIPDKTT